MPPDSESIAAVSAVDRLYAGLMLHASGDANANLGGKLLYAGELNVASSALLIAANIAGAASLTGTADQAMQKRAIRLGLVDFLVTTLDEALRILKNQVRKRETVAVCVAQPSEQVEREMVEIGVLPDLLSAAAPGNAEYKMFLSQGAQRVHPVPVPDDQNLLLWSVAADPLVWLPRLDDFARACLSPVAVQPQRWARLAPRYLGRASQGLRLLRCSTEAAAAFVSQVRQQVADGAINVAVEIEQENGEESVLHQFTPKGARINQ